MILWGIKQPRTKRSEVVRNWQPNTPWSSKFVDGKEKSVCSGFVLNADIVVEPRPQGKTPRCTQHGELKLERILTWRVNLESVCQHDRFGNRDQTANKTLYLSNITPVWVPLGCIQLNTVVFCFAPPLCQNPLSRSRTDSKRSDLTVFSGNIFPRFSDICHDCCRPHPTVLRLALYAVFYGRRLIIRYRKTTWRARR